MVAETGNIHTTDLAGLQNGHPFGDLHRISVHKHLDRIIGIRKLNPRAADGGPWSDLLRRRRRSYCRALWIVAVRGGGDPSACNPKIIEVGSDDGGSTMQSSEEAHLERALSLSQK